MLRRRRPDVVYISTITLLQWPLLARLVGARAITHVHEAVSSALPRLARRAEVIHHGVASPADPPPPRPEIEGALQVLYVGRLSPRKGPDLVIEAAARLQRDGVPVRVSLLGAVFPGYEWFEQELRARARSSGVPVELRGFDPDVRPPSPRPTCWWFPPEGTSLSGTRPWKRAARRWEPCDAPLAAKTRGRGANRTRRSIRLWMDGASGQSPSRIQASPRTRRPSVTARAIRKISVQATHSAASPHGPDQPETYTKPAKGRVTRALITPTRAR